MKFLFNFVAGFGITLIRFEGVSAEFQALADQLVLGLLIGAGILSVFATGTLIVLFKVGRNPFKEVVSFIFGIPDWILIPSSILSTALTLWLLWG